MDEGQWTQQSETTSSRRELSTLSLGKLIPGRRQFTAPTQPVKDFATEDTRTMSLRRLLMGGKDRNNAVRLGVADDDGMRSFRLLPIRTPRRKQDAENDEPCSTSTVRSAQQSQISTSTIGRSFSRKTSTGRWSAPTHMEDRESSRSSKKSSTEGPSITLDMTKWEQLLNSTKVNTAADDNVELSSPRNRGTIVHKNYIDIASVRPFSQPATTRGNLHSLGSFTVDESEYLSDDGSKKRLRGLKKLTRSETTNTPDRLIKYDKPVEMIENALCYNVIDGNNLMVEDLPRELPVDVAILYQALQKKMSAANGSTQEERRKLAELGYYPQANGILVRRMRLRLRSTYAPRQDQKHAAKSKRALQNLVFNQLLQVHIFGKDSHRRALADCIVKADSVRVDEELIRLGAAWQNISIVQNLTLGKLQKKAQMEKVGLWTEARPNPPWITEKSTAHR